MRRGPRRSVHDVATSYAPWYKGNTVVPGPTALSSTVRSWSSRRYDEKQTGPGALHRARSSFGKLLRSARDVRQILERVRELADLRAIARTARILAKLRR